MISFYYDVLEKEPLIPKCWDVNDFLRLIVNGVLSIYVPFY